MRITFIVALAFAISGCNLIYKLPTRQGNVIEQKQLDQLRLGMTPDQVRFLMGTPLAQSPFVEHRWDYLGYYKSPRGVVSQRLVSLYFEGETLARMEGIEDQRAKKGVEDPDLKTLGEQEKQDNQDTSKEPTGVILKQEDFGRPNSKP